MYDGNYSFGEYLTAFSLAAIYCLMVYAALRPKLKRYYQTRERIRADNSALPEEFIVFDILTTGDDPEKDKIVELAAVKVHRDSGRHDTLQAYVKTKKRFTRDVVEYTGLTKSFLSKEGSDLKDVMLAFSEFIGDSRLVLGDYEFVAPFMKAASRETGVIIRNPVSSVYEMRRRVLMNGYDPTQVAADFGAVSYSGVSRTGLLQRCMSLLKIYAESALILGAYK